MSFKPRQSFLVALAFLSLHVSACQRAKLSPPVTAPKGPVVPLSEPDTTLPLSGTSDSQKDNTPAKSAAGKDTSDSPIHVIELPPLDDKDARPPRATGVDDANKNAITLPPIVVSPAPVIPERKPVPSTSTITSKQLNSIEQEIIFVVSTTRSILSVSRQITEAVDHMMVGIPKHMNVRVGVIPAHGLRSEYRGHLFRADDEPSHTALKSEELSEEDFRWHLSRKFQMLPLDPSPNSGAWGLSSLSNALSARNRSKKAVDGADGAGITELLNAGLMRPNVNKAFIFITDANDACSDNGRSLNPLVAKVCGKTTPNRVLQQVFQRAYGGHIELFTVLVDTHALGSSAAGYYDITRMARGQVIPVAPDSMAGVFYNLGRSMNGGR